MSKQQVPPTDEQSEAEMPESGKKWEYVDKEGAEDMGDHLLSEEEGGEYDGLSRSELIKQIETAKEEAAANFDRFARAEARLKNVQHTSKKDVESARKFALKSIVQELVGVVDNFERSFQAMPEASEVVGMKSMFEGLELTHKSLMAALEKVGVEVVNPEGELFNPELHEAMSMQPGTGAAANTVVQVLQKGYTLNQRLIRPAMVIIAKD